MTPETSDTRELNLPFDAQVECFLIRKNLDDIQSMIFDLTEVLGHILDTLRANFQFPSLPPKAED